AGITHVGIFCPKIAKQIINLSLLSHSYPEFKKKATHYCIEFGHSLWSANQLPVQE
ncbi:unnamed protein product, partial [Heterotrigona itama]